MPASAIDRFSNNQGHNGVFAGPVVTGTLPNRRNEAMERISRQSRRLRGGYNMGALGTPLTAVGKLAALEQLTVRLGAIPIVSLPTGTSLSATLQAFPSDRNFPTTPETISVAGGTAAQVFTAAAATAGPPAVAVAFTAAGNGQAVTATDSLDAAAKGRALVDILP
jgi:hypothetical protein